MLARYLIAFALGFVFGFGVATYWQGLERKASDAERSAQDATAVSSAHKDTAALGGSIHEIETASLKDIRHAESETSHIARGLTDGSVELLVSASCPLPMSATAGNSGVADGARARLKRESEPDYLAVRTALKRCPEKVKALQKILQEERRVRNSE